MAFHFENNKVFFELYHAANSLLRNVVILEVPDSACEIVDRVMRKINDLQMEIGDLEQCVNGC